MKILLTNDDGVYASGIAILARTLLEDGHQIVLVAPDRERSAAGHSITIRDPLRATEIKMGIKNLISYKVSGTPADCVKLGLEKLIDFKPQLVISGINSGPNLGYDVLYSGTVSAAIEGWMMGVNSIAVSLAAKSETNYQLAADFLKEFINNTCFDIFDNTILLNINIPEFDDKDHVRITRLGTSLYEDTFEERIDPSGNKYFWLTGGNGRQEKCTDTDIWAIANNYISITPLKIELTNYDMIEQLKKEIK